MWIAIPKPLLGPNFPTEGSMQLDEGLLVFPVVFSEMTLPQACSVAVLSNILVSQYAVLPTPSNTPCPTSLP